MKHLIFIVFCFAFVLDMNGQTQVPKPPTDSVTVDLYFAEGLLSMTRKIVIPGTPVNYTTTDLYNDWVYLPVEPGTTVDEAYIYAAWKLPENVVIMKLKPVTRLGTYKMPKQAPPEKKESPDR